MVKPACLSFMLLGVVLSCGGCQHGRTMGADKASGELQLHTSAMDRGGRHVWAVVFEDQGRFASRPLGEIKLVFEAAVNEAGMLEPTSVWALNQVGGGVAFTANYSNQSLYPEQEQKLEVHLSLRSAPPQDRDTTNRPDASQLDLLVIFHFVAVPSSADENPTYSIQATETKFIGWDDGLAFGPRGELNLAIAQHGFVE